MTNHKQPLPRSSFLKKSNMQKSRPRVFSWDSEEEIVPNYLKK